MKALQNKNNVLKHLTKITKHEKVSIYFYNGSSINI